MIHPRHTREAQATEPDWFDRRVVKRVFKYRRELASNSRFVPGMRIHIDRLHRAALRSLKPHGAIDD